MSNDNNSGQDQFSSQQLLFGFEEALRASYTRDTSDARKSLRKYLWFQAKSDANGSIAEAIEALSASGKSQPDAAAVLLRALPIDNLLPAGASTAQIDRHVTDILERSLPRLCEVLGITSKQQTFEKIPLLRSAHARMLDLLSSITMEFSTLEGALKTRSAVMGGLSHNGLKQYATPFGLNSLRVTLENLYHDIAAVLQERTSLLQDVEQLERTISEGQLFESTGGTFLHYELLLPFLQRVQAALQSFITSARGRFSARVAPTLEIGSPLPKKYPLHEAGRHLHVRVPFRNSGPGLALHVTAELSVDTPAVTLQSSTVNLGDVLPGPFAIVFEILVIEPLAGFSADIVFSWGQAGSPDRQEDIYSFGVTGQDGTIDWTALEYWHPYGTSPAKGDRFVGRSETVRSLAGRILRTPMDSFYITGQKRVGKTSLALASVEFASKVLGHNLSSLYILWGHIANTDAAASMTELGERVLDMLFERLPSDLAVKRPELKGTLAPLARVAEAVERYLPDLRFVLIIDEFDEIHQELYLQGNLAETFFANIRALSTCPNFCVVLVGGENMPFVMERQGAKLNKFTRHNVSYFSRDSEWEDFIQLVRKPSVGTINWHEDAISSIYNETNGNPFFTNLLCSRIVGEAVRARDTDVTVDEVSIALDAEITSLDANSFAHLWQDGIFKAASEREPDVLRRRKILVALGRCSRKNIPLTLLALVDNKGRSGLPDDEFQPSLNDFVRRGVIAEEGEGYRFILPIFERWLREGGLAVVQPDAVSEELAAIVQAEEDAAYIKAEEVSELAKSWPTYQGRRIGSDDIRAWYQQVEGFKEQRVLFKLLQSLRFVSETEVREKMGTAYAQIRRKLATFVRYALADRRDDILITYIDGHGKSGEYYSGLFCEENDISVNSICGSSEVSGRIASARAASKRIEAVIIIDDIAATGQTMADNASTFLDANSSSLVENQTKLVLSTMYATQVATDKILGVLRKHESVLCDFRSGELLPENALPFSSTSKIWRDSDERDFARSLVRDLGSRIYKSRPLGFGDMGMLFAFPTTVPNNSLPIIHSKSKTRNKPWNPLLQRPVN